MIVIEFFCSLCSNCRELCIVMMLNILVLFQVNFLQESIRPLAYISNKITLEEFLTHGKVSLKAVEACNCGKLALTTVVS